MNLKLIGAAAGAMMLAFTGPALAEGELNIYNWGDYTNPELIKKFEQQHNVKVTITDYDSNDTALAKVRRIFADGAGAGRDLCDRDAGPFMAVDRAGEDAGRP